MKITKIGWNAIINGKEYSDYFTLNIDQKTNYKLDEVIEEVMNVLAHQIQNIVHDLK